MNDKVAFKCEFDYTYYHLQAKQLYNFFYKKKVKKGNIMLSII